MSTRILSDGKAFVYAQIAGTVSILLLGIMIAAAFLLFACWLLSQLTLSVVASIVMSCQAIGALYASSDSVARFLLLAGIAFLLYRAGKAAVRRWNHA